MKKLLLLSLIFMSTQAFSQAQDTTEVDPEVMNAILDASKASTSTETKDPLENVVIPEETSLQQKAKDAAKRLKENKNNPEAVLPKKEVKAEVKKEVIKAKGPEVISQEEMELLNKLEKKESASSNTMAADPAKKRKPIYVPAPVEGDDPSAGFLIERDSSKIVTKRMSHNDAINMKMCFASGLTIALDNDIQDEFQRVIVDDKIFIDAAPFDNNRGVYVRLKKPVPNGTYWESAIRLIRKSDDKQYLINLIALPCPSYGMSPFPKALYIQDHVGLIQANNKVLTPEDTIISMSKGMPRIQKNRIRVYDMVASSNSKWVVFGVEVQYPDSGKNTSTPRMTILDNLQVSQIPSKLEFLPVHSKKATEVRGVSTLRFKLSVNIGKNYILKSRYLHLMFLDEEAGHYQYVRVDTLPYFLSLLRRGFEL